MMPCDDDKPAKGRPGIVGLDLLDQFDEVIDARSVNL